ncbi:MAG: twin-arginine translocase TatA/TatE family subunit [Bacillota bacterium]|nr:MAG: twin-arginine translocase TatA/TatE family subunit [Bacillota bacterium]
MFGDLGFGELLVILVAGLVIFGPQRLPEVGRALGTALRELRRASQELMTEVAEAARDLDEPGTRPSHRPHGGSSPGPGAPPSPPEPDAGTSARPDGPSPGAPSQPEHDGR